MLARIISDIAIITATFFFPWWLVCIGVIAGTIFFPWWIEGMIAGCIIDVLYGVPASRFLSSSFIATSVTGCIVVIAEYVKKYLRQSPSQNTL